MGVIYKNLGFLGFPLYEVGNDGSVMSLKWAKTNTKHLLTPGKQKNGYLYVYLTNKKRFYVHRLVAMAFIPNPQCLPIINHKDEDKTNNHVDNLEWCTIKYNRNYGDANKKVSNKLKNHPNLSVFVNQYTRKGVFVKQYPSISEAHRQSGLPIQNILLCCQHSPRYTHCGGYVWRYHYDKSEIMATPNIYQYTKEMVLVGTFGTVKEASQKTGIAIGSINQCFYGKSKSAGGYIWEKK